MRIVNIDLKRDSRTRTGLFKVELTRDEYLMLKRNQNFISKLIPEAVRIKTSDEIFFIISTYFKCNTKHPTIKVKRFSYYFMNKYTKLSFSSMALFFGQNHAMPNFHIRKLKDFVELYDSYRNDLDNLDALIKRSCE